MVHWSSHKAFHLIRDANDDDSLSGRAADALHTLHLDSLTSLGRRSPPGGDGSSGGGDSSSGDGDSSSGGSGSGGGDSSGGSSSSSGGDSSSSSGSSGSSGSSSSSATSGQGNADPSGTHVNTISVAVVCAVVIPILIVIICFTIFHFKNRKKLVQEEALDKHGSLDFGMGEVHTAERLGKLGKKGKLPVPEMSLAGATGPDILRGRGISADLGSPYLVAGSAVESRTSFNSMSRDKQEFDDAYAPIKLINSHSSPRAAGDATSVKTSASGRKPLLGRDSSEKTLPYESTVNTRSNSPSPTMEKTLEKQPSLSRKPVAEAAVTEEVPPPPPFSEKEDSAPQATSNFSFPRNVNRSSISAPQELSAESSAFPQQTGPANPADGVAMYAAYADGLGISEPPPQVAPPRSAGLAPPAQGVDPRRQSGVRPLPNLNPEDNAEQRANRIRSFYREYFNGDGEDGDEFDYYGEAGGYYGEDHGGYGQEYLNEAPIWDAASGAFVMAGSGNDPVTRRAMTPPPRGPPRFRGQAGHHYTSSSGHSGYGRTRAYSSASGKPRGRPVKKLPPPKPLHTLPTPYMLKQADAGLLDFAPPPSMRELAAGRPASPRSEDRPYSPGVKAFSPVVGSSNSLTVMPSPHALRNSSTFTGLDFAPPPRIGDRGDGASDAGSMRSGRSGKTGMVTPMTEYNIRKGTYRLSRLPKNTVGTKDDLAATLRPQWDIGR